MMQVAVQLMLRAAPISCSQRSQVIRFNWKKILLGLSSPRKANLAGGDFNRETIWNESPLSSREALKGWGKNSEEGKTIACEWEETEACMRDEHFRWAPESQSMLSEGYRDIRKSASVWWGKRQVGGSHGRERELTKPHHLVEGPQCQLPA